MNILEQHAKDQLNKCFQNLRKTNRNCQDILSFSCVYQFIPGTDYFETSFVITSQTGIFQHCPIVVDIFILSLLLYNCLATFHGQKEQEQKIKKCIDKVEKMFSLCTASRSLKLSVTLGRRRKHHKQRTNLSHDFMLTMLFNFYFSTNF